EKIHLGTIVEIGLDDGLDTLAVFTDGGVRYINHTGRMAIVEGSSDAFEKEIKQVLTASEPVVNAIGPWKEARRPPPQKGNLRFTFLVSDGLYFGEGPIDVMSGEPMAAPLFKAATALLMRLVEANEEL
ncbi:MAG: hypothetical protein AAF492_27720, partial [Verrucomicrobiota bacterium]